jgi:methylmalonyl-CoA mutase
MDKNLFNEFPSSTPEQWRNQVIKDLKGADFDEKLIWHTSDGIAVQPYYTRSDIPNHTTSVFSHAQWQHCMDVYVHNSKAANEFALKALDKGATGLHFIIDSAVDCDVLFKQILFEYIFCVVEVKTTDSNIIKAVHQYFEKHIDKQLIKELYLVLNPLWLIENGKSNALAFYETMCAEFIVEQNFDLKIDATAYANAGANHTQQLGFVLAQCNAYLNQDTLLAKLNEKKLVIEISVGSNYFFEIAKLRALRQVIAFLLKQYGVTMELIVLSKTAINNKSAADSFTNLLRTTTEAMAAVIGGCNALSVGRYDMHTKDKNEQAIWWALNQSLMLEHEAYLNQMADVAAGSYYIEKLTEQLAENAWNIFKDIENEGGWLAYFESGDATRTVQEAFSDMLQQFQSKESTMIGVNQFINDKDVYTPQYDANVYTISDDFKARFIAQTFNK